MNDQIERELDLQGLRAAFLRHTRAAYARLPAQARRRILDIGCGRGTVTLELARLGDGEIVGIDIDTEALEDLRRRIEDQGPGDRVRIIEGSFVESGLPDGSFDLLWEEGVIHILDLQRSLAECRRLLRPGGYLVSCETVVWFDGALESITGAGFEVQERILWPRGSWWTEYYGPLEQRIQRLRARPGGSRDLSALERHEAEITMVKPDPEKFDCGHFLLRCPD